MLRTCLKFVTKLYLWELQYKHFIYLICNAFLAKLILLIVKKILTINYVTDHYFSLL